MSRLRAPNVRDWRSRAPSSAPRTLFLINDLRMGGAERSLVNIVNHLKYIRAAVVLIEPAADLLAAVSPDIEIFSLDMRHPAPLSKGDRHAILPSAPRRRGRPRGQMLLEVPGLIRKALRLARVARATDGRVVSTFLNRSHTIALVAKLLFAWRLRVVINVHEILSDHLAIHFSPVERRVMRAFIRFGFPLAEQIVVVADSVRNDLVRHFAIAVDRITIVPNPIDVERIRRAGAESVEVTGGNHGAIVIVGVGRLVRLKGFDLLIRAFARLPREIPAKLQIVGDGEERAGLERLAAELKVGDRVEFLGTQLNPWKYMARARVIALPSRMEASPNVLGEALALAIPVVATRCSDGVVTYLEGGRCGLLVPPDDAVALGDALERVLTDEALRRRLIEHASERAAAFDLPHVVERYESVIVELTGG